MTTESSMRESEAVPPLGDVLEFLRVIWALDHALQKSSKRMVTQLGVTGPQRLVVRMVGRFPGIAARELAGILHIHPSTLTGILKRLEALELITRRPHPRDRRRAFLGLTQKGRETDLNSEGTVEAAVKQAIAELEAVKIEHAQEVLSKLTYALEPRAATVEPGAAAPAV